MALSLKAEQKELLKIFKIEEQYVIPAYQRPYSWEYDQCVQLYNDLIEAHKANEEYFIGNLIIAKSEANKEILEVIDGQQRLTTLLLLIKVLYIFQPEWVILNQLLEQENWKGKEPIPRIKSNIFEEGEEEDNLMSVLNYTKEIFESRLIECIVKSRDGTVSINEKKGKNRFDLNILYFYHWISFYVTKKDSNIDSFTTFLLKKVYLLPIELVGKNQEEANEKALIIFETINNRGMNLEDADIFKAKLYKKAKKVKEEALFIDSWREFKNSCQKLNLKIDDVFRYYSHIIRGNKGIITSEKKLREFFEKEPFSPFQLQKYKEILDDLFKIIEVLEYIENQKQEKNEFAKWLQLIDLYTNQYPKFAIIVYLFINGIDDNDKKDKFVKFLKSLVRYVYFHGPTTTVKFEIYAMIRQVCGKQELGGYYQDLKLEFFNQLDQLKYGFALLAFYINRDIALNTTYNISRLVGKNDKKHLTDDWADVNIDNVLVDSLGNFIVTDKTKKYATFSKKIDYYKTSELYKDAPFLIPSFTYENFKNRDMQLKQQVINFFKEPQ
jgi:uncharacterized protein with ParB-like and HNH nuclease domain